jgi:hypothetical protein
MSDKIDPVQAANDLADEANGNGNDWQAWCKPRLDAILAALAARHGGSPGVYLYTGGGVSDPHHEEFHAEGAYTTPREAKRITCVGGGGQHVVVAGGSAGGMGAPLVGVSGYYHTGAGGAADTPTPGGGGFVRSVPVRDEGQK